MLVRYACCFHNLADYYPDLWEGADSVGGQIRVDADSKHGLRHPSFNHCRGFAESDMTRGCMVYTERAETAAVLRGTSHVSAVSTPLRWIFKNAL